MKRRLTVLREFFHSPYVPRVCIFTGAEHTLSTALLPMSYCGLPPWLLSALVGSPVIVGRAATGTESLRRFYAPIPHNAEGRRQAWGMAWARGLGAIAPLVLVYSLLLVLWGDEDALVKSWAPPIRALWIILWAGLWALRRWNLRGQTRVRAIDFGMRVQIDFPAHLANVYERYRFAADQFASGAPLNNRPAAERPDLTPGPPAAIDPRMPVAKTTPPAIDAYHEQVSPGWDVGATAPPTAAARGPAPADQKSGSDGDPSPR